MRKTRTKTSVSFQEADERLEKESQSSQHAHRHKNPKENPVDDHGNVLPVILHLKRQRKEKSVCVQKEKIFI